MEDFSLDAISNPALIEKQVLDAYEKYVTKGEAVIVDANNTFMFLVEMYSQLTAGATNAVLNKLNALYPQRAMTPEDLYMHMSDYDYVGLFSSPASIDMELILGKQELIDNAVPIYDSNGNMLPYSKIVIPDNTLFQIGAFNFGLYYPIEIRINNITKAFSVVYDTSVDTGALNGKNPLTQLTVNTVEYAFQTYKDIEIVSLRFPVYQFTKTIYLQDIAVTNGYKQSFTFNNRFYAIRIYKKDGDQWTEIKQTLSDTVYDPMTVTAKLVVDTENKTVNISIPQIYFTSGLVTSQLKIELYSTYGELDVDITNIAQEQVNCTFQEDKTGLTLGEYSRPLDRAQTLQIYPIATKIIGGSNGYDFATLRSHVINNTFYSNVIARFAALQAKMYDEGFEVMKHQDSIMNRIFYCSKEITGLDGDVIASGSIPLHISSNIVKNMREGSPIPPGYKWVRYRGSDQSFTILPAALLKFDPESGVSELVKDDDYPEMLDTVDKRCDAYNKYQYTYQPLHLRLSMSDTYPVAYSYNLMNPSVDRIFFKGNNTTIGESINGFTGSIIHKNGGTGGYTLRFAVTISENLANMIDSIDQNDNGEYVNDIWLSDIIVYLKYSAPNEATEGCFAILTPTTLRTEEGKYLFELDLTTDYFIDTNHYIEFGSVNQSLDGTQNTVGRLTRNGRVPIESDQWTLTFLMHVDKVKMLRPSTDASIDKFIESARATAMSAGIGQMALDDLPLQSDDDKGYIPIAEQQVTLSFGKYVSQVHNGVEVYTGKKSYQTYPETIYATCDSDLYLRDRYDEESNTNIGDVVFSETMVPEVYSQANDWIFDTFAGATKVKRIVVEPVPLVWDNSFIGKYVKYDNGSEVNAYTYSSTKITISNENLGSIIYDTERKKAVLLSESNIGQYRGKLYPICDVVTTNRVGLVIGCKVSTNIDGDEVIEPAVPVNAGMVVKCLPTKVDGTYIGIATYGTPIFKPGLIVHSVEVDPAYEEGSSPECKVFLENKCLQVGGTIIDSYAVSPSNEYNATNGLFHGFVGTDITTESLSNPDISHLYTNFNVGFGDALVYHQAGDNVLDSVGLPIATSTRSLEYYVDTIQLDTRAYLGSDVNINELRKHISDAISNYATVVDKYRPELLENTHLYYRPKRSIGNASFSVGNNVIKVLPLQLATEFTLTVKSFVYEDDNLRNLLSNKVLEYVKMCIGENMLSATSISKIVLDNLGEYVDAVAVSGFNTKEDLSGALTAEEKYEAYQTQVLRPVDDDAKLSIRRLVYVTDRKLLATRRGITVNFIV